MVLSTSGSCSDGAGSITWRESIHLGRGALQLALATTATESPNLHGCALFCVDTLSLEGEMRLTFTVVYVSDTLL